MGLSSLFKEDGVQAIATASTCDPDKAERHHPVSPPLPYPRPTAPFPTPEVDWALLLHTFVWPREEEMGQGGEAHPSPCAQHCGEGRGEF